MARTRSNFNGRSLLAEPHPLVAQGNGYLRRCGDRSWDRGKCCGLLPAQERPECSSVGTGTRVSSLHVWLQDAAFGRFYSSQRCTLEAVPMASLVSHGEPTTNHFMSK